MSCPVVALVAGVKIGSGRRIGLLQSGRQFDAAHRARCFVFFPSRAREIAARHALDGEHFGAHDHHRTPAKFVGMCANRSRVLGHVGGDEVVGHDVFEEVEPEQGDLRQDAALVRNAGREYVVEG